MKIIDTNDYDTIEEFEILKRDLEDELYIKRKYDISDFALVRTTNFLEEDRMLKALCKIPFVVNTNGVLFSVIYGIHRNKYNINVYDDVDDEKLRKAIENHEEIDFDNFDVLGFMTRNHNPMELAIDTTNEYAKLGQIATEVPTIKDR